MVCNVDCLSTYNCGGSPITAIQPDSGAIYSPYIKLVINDEAVITVGNNSANNNNRAAITSMEFGIGAEKNYGVDIEIIDHGGTMYNQIVQQVNKTIDLVDEETKKNYVDFGWVVTDCNGNSRLVTANSLTGLTLYGYIAKVDQSYENGLMKLKVRLAGALLRANDVRHDSVLFDEDDKGSLTEALHTLFTQYNPKFASVIYKDKDGEVVDGFFKNSDGGVEGPRASWPMSQQDPFAVARSWLQSIRTENDLGILIGYDPNTASVIIQEAPEDEDGNCCNGNLGTFIINAGNCSPVLSFSVSVSWPKSNLPGGGGIDGGASSGESNVEIYDADNIIERAGSQTLASPQEQEWQWRNPDDQAKGAALGIAAHLDAERRVQALGGITAQLKIHGDPSFCDLPGLMAGKTFSLIVLNPFFMSNNGDDCTWLTTSNCNPTLSNKSWRIVSINHQISGGTFVTNFELKLLQPNVDLNYDETLGGAGCGTVSFENSQISDSDN